jgi:ABC-type transporter Mla MlaB component
MATRSEIHIGRSIYYVRKFEPFLALKILGDLQRRFLGPMASFLEAQQGEEMNFSLLVQGISKVSASMDGDTLVQLAKRVLDSDYISVMIDNEPAEKLTENILNRSVDNVGEVIELIAFVLKENYENVFILVRTHIGLGRANGEMRLELSERI